MNALSRNIYFRIMLSAAIFIDLSACATLNESECKTANWEIIGLEDGSQGRNVSYIGEHRKACSSYQITPDLNAYMKGHAAGLRQFCTERNGYQQGRLGARNNNVCPANLAKNFQRGYQQGYPIFLMESEINRLRHAIDSYNARLVEITELTQDKEAELVSHDTQEYRRRELLTEIKSLERESEATHIEVSETQVMLLKLEEDYQRLTYNRRG